MQVFVGYISLRPYKLLKDKPDAIDSYGISKEKLLETDIPVFAKIPKSENLIDPANPAIL